MGHSGVFQEHSSRPLSAVLYPAVLWLYVRVSVCILYRAVSVCQCCLIFFQSRWQFLSGWNLKDIGVYTKQVNINHSDQIEFWHIILYNNQINVDFLSWLGVSFNIYKKNCMVANFRSQALAGFTNMFSFKNTSSQN